MMATWQENMTFDSKEDTHAIIQSGKESVEIEEFLKIHLVEQ